MIELNKGQIRLKLLPITLLAVMIFVSNVASSSPLTLLKLIPKIGDVPISGSSLERLVLKRSRFRAIIAGSHALSLRDRTAFESDLARVIDSYLMPNLLTTYSFGHIERVHWEEAPSSEVRLLKRVIQYFRPATNTGDYYRRLLNSAIYYNKSPVPYPYKRKQRLTLLMATDIGRKTRLVSPGEWGLVHYLKRTFNWYTELSREVLRSKEFQLALDPVTGHPKAKIWREFTEQGVVGGQARGCGRVEVNNNLRKTAAWAKSELYRNIKSEDLIKQGAVGFSSGYAKRVVDAYRKGLMYSMGLSGRLAEQVYSRAEIDGDQLTVVIAEPCGQELSIEFVAEGDIKARFGNGLYFSFPQLHDAIFRVETEVVNQKTKKAG